MSSAAASPGRGGVAGGRRGVPVVLHEMRPRARRPRRTRPTAWPSWSAPTPSAPTTAENNAVGLLHEEMRRAGSLILRAADAPQAAGRRRAGGRPRRLLRRRRRAALAAHPLIDDRARGGRRPAAGRLGQRRSSPPAPSPRRRWPRRSRALTGEDSLAFFDAIAPDRPSRQHRHGRSPGCSRATTRRARAATAPTTSTARSTRTQYEAFIAALLRRRQDRVQGVGKGHALFRGLPADRGDGRARPRDAALRADEAGRPDRSAHRPAALRRRAAAPGQCAGHAVEHGRLPDQAEARRAGRASSARSPAWRRPSSRGSAACTATPSSTARACSTARCG